MATHHVIPETPEHTILGYLDATTPPILTVESGDTVTLRSFPAGGQATLPPDLTSVPDAYRAALDTLPPGPGPHFMTGPVSIRGAMAGDTLQVDVLDATPSMDWGFVAILPLLGTLPDEFTDYETIHPRIDRARGVCVLPWGTELPLDPFFGILATAPPLSWGRCSSSVPRAFGGNMDNSAPAAACPGQCWPGSPRAGQSTSLELFGQGEWDAEKHGRAPRQWRKLHLAVDAGTGEIAARVLTDGHADDVAQVPALLGQAEGVVASVTADVACDGKPACAATAERQRYPPPHVVPPRASAVPSSDEGDSSAQSQRGCHIQLIARRGRMGRQRATGYGRRNQAETACSGTNT